MIPVVLSWSGGKDSALALRALRAGGEYRVVSLLTTFTEDSERVAIHDVPLALIEAQAASLGLPLRAVPLPAACVNDVCPPESTRAARTASTTPSSTTDRASAPRWHVTGI